MSVGQVVAVFVVLLVASAAQAITGFGFAMVAVPLLTMVCGPRVAVVGASLVALVTTSATALHDRRAIAWWPALTIVGAGVLGAPLGLLLLTRLPTRALSTGIALVVCVFAFVVWWTIRAGRTARPDTPATALAAESGESRESGVVPTLGGVGTLVAVGVLCGALTTSTGVNGPPMVAAFQALRLPPRVFRATLAAVFVASGLVGAAGFAATGQVTGRALAVAGLGIPAVAVGWWLGNRVFGRISAHRFQRVVLVALAVMSVVTLGTALV